MSTTIPTDAVRPGNTPPHTPSPGDVWMLLTSIVFDHRGAWRTQVAEATGMPFSRFRALRRLARTSLTGRELAQLLDIDAAATSVIVSDLDARGLVQRTVDPGDARRKIITITEAGLAVLDSVRELGASTVCATLDTDDLTDLHRLLTKLQTGQELA